MKLLFICSKNQCRSITAERVFHGVSGYEVKSAGTDRGARTRVKREHIEWAELIFAMEHRHVQYVQSEFKELLTGKRLICLEIPDKYGCMTRELIDTLRKRLKLYLSLRA